MTDIDVHDVSSPAEWEQLLALLVSVFVGEGYTGRADAKRLFQRAELQQHGDIIVATDVAGTVRGIILLLDARSELRQVARNADEDEFRLLAVSPSARGSGIGCRLIEECGRRASEPILARALAAAGTSALRATSCKETRSTYLDHSAAPGRSKPRERIRRRSLTRAVASDVPGGADLRSTRSSTPAVRAAAGRNARETLSVHSPCYEVWRRHAARRSRQRTGGGGGG
jgi:GNAT superfamily N-acetyltransferase